ncbi:MAG: Gfo/Idh/MocA family oxidoreductase [Verrucomicrobiota bacterium]
MNDTPSLNPFSRRDFLKTSGLTIGATSLTGLSIPHVFAEGSEQLQVALVGCGGRGTGAAVNAMSQVGGPKLVAMADVFEHKLNGSYTSLKGKFKDQVDVPDSRKFLGFDAYKNAMDCLKKGDIAIFTTPLAFRWVHFKYAIEKGLHVFMEKPVTADGPSSRRMLELAKQASAKNLKVGVGLMSRHSHAMQELHQRIQDGEIGDVNMLRGYRMQGVIGSAFSEKWTGPGQTGPQTELLWQISRFHSFLWASGGAFSDFYIHHVDHLCWLKNAWPVKCHGVGGRTSRRTPSGGVYVDQNFDSYAVEYTFADGAKLLMDGRCMNGALAHYASYAHGSKGMAIVSKNGDCGRPSSTYKGQSPDAANLIWTSADKKTPDDPYFNEWQDLLEAIRSDKPYNEVERGVMASVVTSMGRYATHTAQEVTLEEMLNHEHEYAPDVDKWTNDSAPPVNADENGLYPIPEPGIKTKREF